MGNTKNIAHNTYPRQSKLVGRSTEVAFNYDLAHRLNGVIVRHDVEHPWETIIRLDDGRHVRGVECQYCPAQE